MNLLPTICLLGLWPIFAFAQEPRLIEPGETAALSAELQPYWARYRETRTRGDQKLTSYRLTQLQALPTPQGLAWQAVIHMLGTDTVTDEWRFLQKSFDPVARIISARSMVHKIEIYGDQVQGASLAGDGSGAKPLAMVMEGRRFPGTVAFMVMSQMELKAGDLYIFPVFSSDMGPANANLYSEMKVLRQERINTGDGKTYGAWVLENGLLDENRKPLKMGTQPFPKSLTWIVAEAPYVLKSEWPHSEIVLDRFVPLPKFPVSPSK